MKLRTDKNLRVSELTPSEVVLSHIQWLRANAQFMWKEEHWREHLEKLEKEYVELCRDLEHITAGDKSILLRALRMYMAQYQESKGREKDPAHKQDLQNYIDAAGRLYEKLFGLRTAPAGPSEKDLALTRARQFVRSDGRFSSVKSTAVAAVAAYIFTTEAQAREKA